MRKSLTRGLTDLYGLPDRRLKKLSIGLASLSTGDRFAETLNRREAVLVLLHGRIYLKGQGFDFGEIDAGQEAFEDSVSGAYCPPGLFAIKANSDCDVVIMRWEGPHDWKGGQARVIIPDKVREQASGGKEATVRFLHEPANRESAITVGITRFSASVSGAGLLPAASSIAAGKAEGICLFRFESEDETAQVELSAFGDAPEEIIDVRHNDVIIIPAGTEAQVRASGLRFRTVWATCATV